MPVTGERGGVGDRQHHQHQQEGDSEFRDERRSGAGPTRDGGDVVDGRIRDGPIEQRHRQPHAPDPPEELSADVSRDIGRIHPTQPGEGEGDGGIQVCSRTPPPGRIGIQDGGQPHGHPHQPAAKQRTRPRRRDRRRGMEEEHGEPRRRDHEEAETECLEEVFGPVMAPDPGHHGWALSGAAARARPGAPLRACPTPPLRPVWNSTRSLVKTRSSAQSRATRTLRSKRGSLAR